ncbi:DUF5677 domain-containing protein [Streptomyces sp. NPDC091879]|uniref:DUF5677 domain-containing protein n=1 Tax=Streptomyces sp. NPDC091879 TaxID=3366006 RepID=UPI003824C900
MDDAKLDNDRAYLGLQALAQLVEGDHPFKPADEDGRAFEVAWGFLAAALRQGSAVVLLHRHGLAYDSAPNRRALLEHAARIWWLAQDGDDAVDAMNRALQKSQKELRKAVDAAGMQYDATIADAVQAAELPPSSAETFNHFKHLMERMGPPMAAIWIGESQTAHPTLTSAQLFVTREDDTLTLHAEPVYPDGLPTADERAPFIALVLVWMAMLAFNELLAGGPWTDELQEIAADAGIEDMTAGVLPQAKNCSE